MPSHHWIKLYDAILSNPQMGMMDDHLWRRTIELFLLAGKNMKNGLLPPARDIAWMLHTSEGEVLDVLYALRNLEIVNETPEGWVVTNFVKWQTSESLERVRRYRDKQNTRESNVNVTDDVAVAVTQKESSSSSLTLKSLKGKDPRTTHPAIQAIFKIVGRYPAKDQYDVLIEVLGDKPDTEKLRRCWSEWRAERPNKKPFSPMNYGWITDWYKNGIPGKNNRQYSEVY